MTEDKNSAEHSEPPQQPNTSMLYCFGVSLSYALVSVAITFINKIVLSVYQFKFEQTLILMQLLVGSFVIFILSAAGLCRVPAFDFRIAVKALPLSIWFFLYVVTGLGSLRSLTVPTWSALRRLTALFILLFDAIIDGRSTPFYWQLMSRYDNIIWRARRRPAPVRVWLSVALMIVGGTLAAAGDIDGAFLCSSQRFPH